MVDFEHHPNCGGVMPCPCAELRTLRARVAELEEERRQAIESGDAPHVCPGCHAVGEERCAPGCIDAELEEELRHAIESGDYDRMEEEE